jgi:acyl-CoA synthetase (AMP-forming)/AMP-acid ligase II
VVRPGFLYSEREVVKYCLAHLENHMAPKYVEFVAALPQTGTGKISKQLLTEEKRMGRDMVNGLSHQAEGS